LQFCKAIEKELVGRYRDICRRHEHCDASERVTLGNVVTLIKQASEGDQARIESLNEIGCKTPPDKSLTERLARLNAKYRNEAAHPNKFPLQKLDDLRQELFTDGLLRDVLEKLL
jgi:hypothetical protein